ncbi:hypothetical protein [Streptomyces sp. NBC_01296]|uniref:hypothetical protein n=1 Tax=Streptomyces sp. NBC_01296 TaxID=2903816 RepID=UPI002E11F587|nr:hypothetical protein OG299_02990 [Streptomyces sp. NBC_01296]
MTRPLPRGATLLLAAMAGTAIANNYAVQPALTAVAADLDVPLSVIGLVPTAALTGCVAGFAFLLPLTDPPSAAEAGTAPPRPTAPSAAGIVRTAVFFARLTSAP